jgi:hypothetical protein
MLFFLITSSSHAQEIKSTENELKNMLCKQWTIEYVTLDGEKSEYLPGPIELINFKFNKDGTYELIKEFEENNIGSWIYIPENKYVELVMNKSTNSRITYIDKTKLIILLIPDKNDPPGLPDMEFHLKPK